MNTNYLTIKQTYDLAGFLFEEDKINLFGIRTWYDGKESNKFDDFKGFTYQNKVYWHRATVDPGTVWGDPEVRKKYHISSADFLLPGQYVNVYRLGNHRGYKALVQTGSPVMVTSGRYTSDVTEGYFGISWHRANELRIVGTVGLYSAGCQVTLDPEEFDRCINLFESTKQESFSYALFEQEEAFDAIYKNPDGGMLNGRN